MEKIEIWISPEQAEALSVGSIMTLVITEKKKMGDGYLVSGNGAFVNAGVSIEDAPVEASGDLVEDAPSYVNLSGSHDSKPVSSFAAPAASDSVEATEKEEPIVEVAEPASKKIEPIEKEPVEKEEPVKESALAFGERGPQLINGEETPRENLAEDKSVAEEKAPQPRVDHRIIDNIKDLYNALSKVDTSQIEADHDVTDMNAEQRRELAVELEKSGKIGCGFSAYVKNICGGQLVLSDIDVRIRHGDSYNLGRVSPSKLMKSVELFEAVNMNLQNTTDGILEHFRKCSSQRRHCHKKQSPSAQSF